MHEALLTNCKRKRIGLTSNECCPRCPGQEETLLHVLRDCRYIRRTWMSSVDKLVQEQSMLDCSKKEWKCLTHLICYYLQYSLEKSK
ncbi:hypothetical protein Ahy_A03g010838 [Arachis hypogaea]|uniref:Uncharacterized protein n=1 Tax=Arachis hypogaea TaxID=3818 RepID=A0A445DNS0_ARAHY|nr:hypothetical protein Ahy_A03g010838 [Arachis hypogaea]